jgi:hypothetical protein
VDHPADRADPVDHLAVAAAEAAAGRQVEVVVRQVEVVVHPAEAAAARQAEAAVEWAEARAAQVDRRAAQVEPVDRADARLERRAAHPVEWVEAADRQAAVDRRAAAESADRARAVDSRADVRTPVARLDSVTKTSTRLETLETLETLEIKERAVEAPAAAVEAAARAQVVRAAGPAVDRLVAREGIRARVVEAPAVRRVDPPAVPQERAVRASSSKGAKKNRDAPRSASRFFCGLAPAFTLAD